MDEQTRRTGRFIGEEAHHSQQESQQREQARQAESRTRESDARITYEAGNRNQFDTKGLVSAGRIDLAYQYQLGKELEQSKNKPLDTRTTDVKISKEIFKATQGQHFDKVRDAIKDHSSIAAQVPEHKRHEYANVAATKGQMEYLKDVPREEKTRVQTKHSPQPSLTEQEIYRLHQKNLER